MFTILKVRGKPDRADVGGWYDKPEGTVADVANDQGLAADGVDPDAAV